MLWVLFAVLLIVLGGVPFLLRQTSGTLRWSVRRTRAESLNDQHLRELRRQRRRRGRRQD